MWSTCVPLVAETYGAGGNVAIEVFSQLASRIAASDLRACVEERRDGKQFYMIVET